MKRHTTFSSLCVKERETREREKFYHQKRGRLAPRAPEVLRLLGVLRLSQQQQQQQQQQPAVVQQQASSTQTACVVQWPLQSAKLARAALRAAVKLDKGDAREFAGRGTRLVVCVFKKKPQGKKPETRQCVCPLSEIFHKGAWLALGVAEELFAQCSKAASEEQATPDAALEAYKKATLLLRHRGAHVPCEVSNNVAVLHAQRGDGDKARQALFEALGCSVCDEDEDETCTLKLTIVDEGSCDLTTCPFELSELTRPENAPLWRWRKRGTAHFDPKRPREAVSFDFKKNPRLFCAFK